MVKNLIERLKCNNEHDALFNNTSLLHRHTLQHYGNKAHQEFYKMLYLYCVQHDIKPSDAYDNVVEYHLFIKEQDIEQNIKWWITE